MSPIAARVQASIAGQSRARQRQALRRFDDHPEHGHDLPSLDSGWRTRPAAGHL